MTLSFPSLLKKHSTSSLIGILLLFAFFYYSYYYRCSLYPAGEGGCEGVTALRLLAGQIPMKEAILGYNLLWFYPIVALFKIVGPSYTFLRIYFFLIATATSLLAFMILKMTTQRSWVAFLGALLALILPGQLFRNYMAFLVMLNMTFFLKTFFFTPSNCLKKLLWITATGTILGLTFLFRVDLGYFLSVIFIGLIVLTPWFSMLQEKHKTSFLRDSLFALLGLILATSAAIIVHIPFYCDAVHRGFSTAFLEQYKQLPRGIFDKKSNLQKFLNPKEEKQKQVITSIPSSITQPPSQKETTLARYSLKAHKMRERLVALNLYLPILVSFFLAVMGASFLFLKQMNSHERLFFPILLTSLGCSLALFPQYFFWRPDMVHFSEFMVPMMVTMMMALSIGIDIYKKASLFIRSFIFLFCFFGVFFLLLYLDDGCQSQSTGGIAISHHRTMEFKGANGVAVKLTPSEFQDTSAVYQSILTHSKPGEYVTCYPYNPEINFMTDRPSYRQNLYIDDLTAPADFDALTIAEIEQHHPAVIVITDWPINGTEHSRFTNWAAGAYDYIKSHYIADYEREIIHVFVRPF